MNALSYRHGIVITTGSSFLGRLVVVISGIILAKTLEPSLLGKFSADQALVLIGGGLINLGIGQGYRQIVSRNTEMRNSYLCPAIFIRMVSMLVYFVGLSVYLNYSGRWSIPTILVATSTLLFFLVELFRIDLQIFRSYVKVSVLIWGHAGTLLIAAVACWASGGNYSFLIYPYLFLAVSLVTLSWAIVKPHIASLAKLDYRTLIRTSIPFSAAIFAYAFTSFWGLTYIREVLGEQQAGYYCIPLRVYQIALIVGMSVSGVTLPLYHKLAATGDFETFGKVFQRLIRGMWFIGGPIAAVCFFIPEFVIRVFANESYLASAAIFPWIGFGLICRLVAIPAGNILESIDRQWYRVGIQVVGAIGCMLGVIFLVPAWGIIGAAWTLFAVDVWILSAYWLIAYRFAPAVVALRTLLVPGLTFVLTLFIISHYLHVALWLKLFIFSALWVSYVIICLNFKEEIIIGLRTISAGRTGPRG